LCGFAFAGSGRADITPDRRAAGAMSGLSGGHAAARFSTVMAGFGTLLAVIVLVLTALVAALLTQVGAQLAKRAGRFALQRHKLRRQPTETGTLHVQPDTVAHHLQVLFLQAGCRTVIAGCGTQITGLNALFKFVVHVASLCGFACLSLEKNPDYANSE